MGSVRCEEGGEVRCTDDVRRPVSLGLGGFGHGYKAIAMRMNRELKLAMGY
jgi:hypothetical protein